MADFGKNCTEKKLGFENMRFAGHTQNELDFNHGLYKITMLFYNPCFNQRTLLYEYVIIRDYIRDSEYLLISKIRRIINYSHYTISWGKARFVHNPQTAWSLKYVNGRFWKNCIEKKNGQWKHATWAYTQITSIKELYEYVI
jgi:hypothetical protein